MFAYEFYWFDKTEEPHFPGAFLEGGKNLLRITRESVMNSGRKVIANNADATNIYFIQVRGVAGGWIAGLVQGTTTALRAKSSVSTAGIANVLVSTQSLRKT